MKNQLAVIMFADIVSYSAMMQADQEKTVGHVRALRNTHLEPVVLKHDGRVLKRLGDGWIVSFNSIADCVECAMEVQTGMQSIAGVQLRIGCHFGDIVEEEEDIYGSGVNIAQRIQSEAPPGGVMVSEDVARQLSGRLAEDLKEAGVFRLKNIAQPVRLFQWRPAQKKGQRIDDVTSIAVAATDFAPKDAETEALAGDLHDQLISRMSRRIGVVVFEAANRDVASATYDLRSRLRVADGRGRFSLSLVLRADGRPVWSETYDRDFGDVFEFCDALLEQAEADLRLQTNAFDGDRLAHVPDDALSVSELRARAANLYYRGTYDDWLHGHRLMERAVEMNPTDAVALAMRGEAAMKLAAARYEILSAEEIAHLESDLDTGVENAPSSDYVFWARGMFRIMCFADVPGASSDLDRSRQINPAYRETHELEGHIHMMREDFAAAARSFGLLVRGNSQDPLVPSRLFMQALALYCAQDFEAAARQARAGADMRPKERMMHVVSAMACRASGQDALATRLAAKAAALPVQRTTMCSRPLLPPSQAPLQEALDAAWRGA